MDLLGIYFDSAKVNKLFAIDIFMDKLIWLATSCDFFLSEKSKLNR